MSPYKGCLRIGVCPRHNDRRAIQYNPPLVGSVHKTRFHNFISLFIKEDCCFLSFYIRGLLFGSICGEISMGFGPNGGLGSKEYV